MIHAGLRAPDIPCALFSGWSSSPSTARPSAAAVDAPVVQTVLGQLHVDARTNEHKAALALLEVSPPVGKIVTGAAIFTHRDVREAMIDGGGDYGLAVKANQPSLAKDIEAAFAEPEAGLSPLSDGAEYETDAARRRQPDPQREFGPGGGRAEGHRHLRAGSFGV